MNKLYSTLIFSISILASTFSTAQSILPSDAKIQYSGRIDFSDSNQPTFQFPGVSIKAKFNGTGISADIHDYGDGTDAGANFYKVIIDGTVHIEQIRMDNGLNTYSLATGLTAGDHTVEIVKITEGASGKSSFKGFTVVGGNQSLLDLPTKPNKRIEFIGDSWTCGFGNLSQYATGSASMVYGNYHAKNEDNYYAWGPLTARDLGAEYHVTAISGRGLYRNNTGSMNGTLPKNYDNIFEDDNGSTYDHSSFHPDVVSIHLGTNDLALEENGQSNALDDAAFKATYIDFINSILAEHPCAQIIICFGNSKTDSWPTWTKQLTRLRTMANEISALYPSGHVHTLELPFTAEYTANPCGYGDAWHPSLCSHEVMSEKLVDKINAINVDWGNNSNCPDPTGTKDNHVLANDITIFPNPTANMLNIQIETENVNWAIRDLSGSIIRTGTSKNIAIDDLSVGIYFIGSTDGSWNKKFMKI